MEKILESNNYGMFEMCEFNRDIRKIRPLVNSMKKYGFRSSTPIEVVKNGKGKMKIRSGHHRFVAAQTLKIPIKYIVMDDDITIYEMEETVNNWSMKDYLDANVREGKEEYIEIRKYCEETGLTISNAIAILKGSTSLGKLYLDKFKIGEFERNRDSELYRNVLDIFSAMKSRNIHGYNVTNFARAVAKCCLLPEFRINHFISRIKQYPFLFKKMATTDQYVDLIEEIYNYKSREKFPLRFRVDEKMKERSLNLLRK